MELEEIKIKQSCGHVYAYVHFIIVNEFEMENIMFNINIILAIAMKFIETL
jgi:hypothetical protein